MKGEVLSPAGVVAALLGVFCVCALPACTPDFVTVPSGGFVMGSPETEPGRDDDEALRPVALAHDFEIMTGEVTQGRFLAVMGYNPSFFPNLGEHPDFPVDQVSWFDALAFANKLSGANGYAACTVLTDVVCQDGSPGDEAGACQANGGIRGASVSLNGPGSLYACEGYRLPTEAEWEYAARAGTGTAFPTGDITCTSCKPLDPNLDEVGWYCGNLGGKTTHVVKKKAPNPWGVYDMAGNVAEWTWDWYAAQWSLPSTDPEGPADGYHRVVRGGAGWYHGAARCRSADRAGHTPGYRDRFLGFRLVRTLGGSGARAAGSATAISGPASTLAAAENQGQGGAGPGGAAAAALRHAAAGSGAAALRPAAGGVIGGLTGSVGTTADPGRTGSWEALGSARTETPQGLPFDFVRPGSGVPLTPAEVTAFTAKLTGFWRDVGYFDWLERVTHGMDATNPYGMPEYKLYWQDVRAIKASGVVTFEHTGFADNLTIPTPKVLMNTADLYLATGDERLGRLVKLLSFGMTAGFRGLLWDAEDPETALTARTIFTQDHAYVQEGRQTAVAYGPAKHESIDWNAQTIPNPTNPYWGDIWVRNWRSKDDVPHMLRAVPTLLRVAAAAPHSAVRAAAGQAAATLARFTRDIVDTGWHIRSKDRNGDAYVPLNPDGGVADLASFVEYNFILPDAECNPKLTAALIAYGDARGLDCGSGFGDLYELFAIGSHYYNLDIIVYFHAAAITNALAAGQDELALELLEGMAARVDGMAAGEIPHSDDPGFPSDLASFLLVAGSGGLPLTADETRQVLAEYSRAVDHFAAWPNWDLWAPSVPDGVPAWEPDRSGSPTHYVEITEMIYPLEYCASPWRNETGEPLFDCEIVLDPARWGEGG